MENGRGCEVLLAGLSAAVNHPCWRPGLAALLASAVLLLAGWLLMALHQRSKGARSRRQVFLVDFVAQRPDASWRHSRAANEAFAKESKGLFDPQGIDFMRKVLWASGLGNETHVPPWNGTFSQEHCSMENARLEFDLVAIQACRALLQKTGVGPDEIGILVVNCSMFCPTPSLCATIMNKLHMRGPHMLSFNLGGMGCAASPIAIDLAARMLQLVPNTYALVVSTENITQNLYKGKQRSMLISNVLFRAGAAAMLLTNKACKARAAKYRLGCVVRTTLAGDDTAFNCVMEMEDAAGHRGVKLSKELTKVAAKALRMNLTTLGPKVLPLAEQLRFAGTVVARQLLGAKAVKPYTPDFTAGVQHFCIHTGGRGVIDAIERELGVSQQRVEPSRAALYRFGNVSSSSIWYVLAFIEHFRGVQRGDKVLQLAFGSGFKCNSMVWIANRSFSEQTETWEGFDLAAMHEDLSTLEQQLNGRLDSLGKATEPAGCKEEVEVTSKM